jgi:hypothetical protein
MFALHDRQRKYAACDMVCQQFAAIVACELAAKNQPYKSPPLLLRMLLLLLPQICHM